MNAHDFMALAPLLSLALTAITVMLAIAMHRDHKTTAVLTLLGIGLSIASLPIASSVAPRQVTSLIIIDHHALFYIGLILLAAFCVAGLSYSYLAKHNGHREEYYLLLLLAALGCAVLPAATHFASFFLGLELLSVPLYALAAYLRHRDISVEAGVKYLILAAVSSSFILFGMALVYAATGSMTFLGIALEASVPHSHRLLFLTGVALIIAGLGFKLAVVPFHLWTPDVYEGAPAPVSAFIATASKGSVFALAIRYFNAIDIRLHAELFMILSTIAVASMLAGNILALLQTKVKRILAYSSISHLGYLLVTILATGPLARSAAAFYLTVYSITSLGAFGVVAALSTAGRDADDLDDYRGLAARNPLLAAVFAIMLFSLAGLPVTAGFFAKFYLMSGAVASGLWLMIAVLIVGSIMGLFYYLRIVGVLFDRPEADVALIRHNYASHLILVLLAIALLVFGLFPSLLLDLID